MSCVEDTIIVPDSVLVESDGAVVVVVNFRVVVDEVADRFSSGCVKGATVVAERLPRDED